MIFSSFNSRDEFKAYPAAIQRALKFLLETDLMALELGRHELEGDKMFVNVMDMTTRPFEGSHPEVHEKYIDLMYWPEGGEKIGYTPYSGKEKLCESRPENDISFVDQVENENFLIAKSGCFAIFFPWDAHRPALYLDDKPEVSRKVVVKISVDLL